MFSSGPKYERLTANLRLAINRLKLLEKKKTELAVKARREIADYLAAGKEERARIRVEHIVREDYLVEAMELVEMYCDLLLARMGLIQNTKVMDAGLEEPIASILWATPRLQADCQELVIISEQLAAKYGKEYVQSCRSNQLNNVNEKLIHKLSVQAPPRILIDKYLEEIAKSFNVPFVPSPNFGDSVQTDLLGDMSWGGGGGNQDDKKGGGGGGGVGGGGNSAKLSASSVPFSYPPVQQPFAYPQGPANQQNPPYGNAQPYPPGFIAQPHPNQQPNGYVQVLPDHGPTGNASRSVYDDLPDLPAVPNGTVRSIKPAGDDVNFDDLTKRFEELKKRK